MTNFGGSYSEDIDAPMERCFAIAADVERAPEWQGSMKSATAVEHDAEGRPALVDTEIDGIISTVKVQLRFSYEEPGGMSWERVSGDLKTLSGSWTFDALEDGRTRATYTLDFDPGRALSMLAKGPVVGKVRDHLGAKPPKGLKARAEAN